MSPTVRRWSGRSTSTSTRRSSSRIATRVSRWLPLIRISRFKRFYLAKDGGATQTRLQARRCRGKKIPGTGGYWVLGPRLVDHFAQNLPRDDDPLDLAGAFADLADLGVAHHALDRVLGGVAVASEDLHRLGGGSHGQLGTVELGHRRLLLERLAVLLEPGGMIEQMGAGLDLHRHVGQLEAHRLEAADEAPELLPHAGVPQRLFVGPFRDPQREGGDS